MRINPIRFSGHARDNMYFRGATEKEIIQAIQENTWQPAYGGRMECRMNFIYGRIWNGKRYETKQVRPIFVEQAEEIVVVTVYVYYF